MITCRDAVVAVVLVPVLAIARVADLVRLRVLAVHRPVAMRAEADAKVDARDALVVVMVLV